MSEKAIAEKKKVVDEFKDKISRAKVMVLSETLGLTVKEVTELRKKLRAEDAEFRVVKNTLLYRAAAEVGLEGVREHFNGPTAVLLGYKDAVSPIKILVKFLKDTGKGKMRLGRLENGLFNSGDLESISKLPPKEVLIAKVLGGLQSPIYGLVFVLQGSIRKLVYALAEVQKKKGGE